MHGPMKVNKKN